MVSGQYGLFAVPVQIVFLKRGLEVAMTHTEFWDVLRSVFPGGRAESVARDLVLPQLQSLTCEEALAAGMKPIEIWKAVVEEMSLPVDYIFLHRRKNQKTTN